MGSPLQNPPIGSQPSGLVPGMSAPAVEGMAGPLAYTGGFPNITDSSLPGLQETEQPGSWVYDFDPGTGSARATFQGIVSFTSGGSFVSSFNGRTGAVTLSAADVNGLTALTLPAGSLASRNFNIQGVTDGSNAPAGDVGEFLTATGTIGPNPNVPGNATSLTLSPGDWDVWGNYSCTPGSGNTMQVISGNLNTTSATLSAGNNTFFSYPTQQGQAAGPVATARFNVTANTVVYLVLQWGGTSVGPASVLTGWISARRVR